MVRIKYQNQLQGSFEVRQEFKLSVRQHQDALAQGAIESWCAAYEDNGDCDNMNQTPRFNIPSDIRVNGFSIRVITQEEYRRDTLS